MWDLIVATVATGADIIVVILWKYVRRDSLEGAQIPRKKRVDWGGRYESKVVCKESLGCGRGALGGQMAAVGSLN